MHNTTLKQEIMPQFFSSDSFFDENIKPIFWNIVDDIYHIKSDFEIKLINSLEISYDYDNNYYYISPVEFINNILSIYNLSYRITIDYKDENLKDKLKIILETFIREINKNNNLDNRFIYEELLPNLKRTYVKLDHIIELSNYPIDSLIKNNIKRDVKELTYESLI